MNYLGTVAAIIALVSTIVDAHADDIACISTTFRIIGANDKVCVSAFDDPKVRGPHATSAKRARVA